MTAGRLETVRRVAELRESAARAAVAAAQAARAAAAQERQERVAAVVGRQLRAGSAPDVHDQLARVARLADHAREASTALGARESERGAAVDRWIDATRRARLLGEVCGRSRAERASAHELATQHLLDDLAGSRTRRSA